MTRRRSPFVLAAAVLAALAGRGAADIDVEVRSGDQAKGTIDPGAEVETFRFVVPAGAKLSAKAKPGRKGPAVALAVTPPGGAAAPAPLVGKGAALVVPSTAATGEVRADVTSRDGAATGDYSFSVKWTAPRSVVRPLALAPGESQTGFSADAGAKVRLSVKPAKGSGAIPRITVLDGPAGAIPLSTGPILLPVTGDYTLTLANDGEAGDAEVRLAFTPPRSKPRKIDVTARKTGTAGDDGAYARVVGTVGGSVEVPDGVAGLESLVGTAVDVPPGALPAGTAILIGTAPDLRLPGEDLAQIGPPVFFGPEGQTFGTKSDPKTVTISIPVDLAAVGGDSSQVRVYTRDARGKVTEVPAASLDFVSRPGFVSFPTPHFSSYVTAAEAPPGDGRTLLTYATGPAGGDDLAFSLLGGESNRFLFVTDGTDVLREVVFNETTLAFESRAWAGGGASTSDGTPKDQFDFPGRLTSVLSTGDAVYVGTSAFAIFRIDGQTGAVTRHLGDGVAGDSGDDGPATSARIRDCSDLMEDQDGDLWFVDSVAARVRRIDSSGIVATVAGTGTSGSNGDAGTLAQTQLDTPRGIAERLGTLDVFVAERGRIRVLHRDLDTVETLAGDPAGAPGCVGGPQTGTSARFDGLAGIAFDFSGNQVLVTSDACDAIWSVHLLTREARVELGVPGQPGSAPDGNVGPTTRTSNPRGLAGFTSVVYFVESGTGRVRHLSLPTGSTGD